MCELESRAGIVVEAAHEPVIQREWHANRFQDFLDLLEMLPARLIEKLADARQVFNDRLIFRNFAIKHAQRISHRAALAIDTHFILHRIQRFSQGFVVGGAVICTSDGIKLELPAGNSQSIEHRCQ